MTAAAKWWQEAVTSAHTHGAGRSRRPRLTQCWTQIRCISGGDWMPSDDPTWPRPASVPVAAGMVAQIQKSPAKHWKPRTLKERVGFEPTVRLPVLSVWS